MNFQRELRKAKQVIREWVHTNFSDEKLAGVAAFNADGKMSFRNPCSCLMGVTYSNRLHTADEACNREHYRTACRLDLAHSGRFAALFSSTRMGKVEKAYIVLGLETRFHSCFGDDQLRARRFAALLRAEMRRRAKLRVISTEDVFDLPPRVPGAARESESTPFALRL
jgi:hypothetical protein